MVGSAPTPDGHGETRKPVTGWRVFRRVLRELTGYRPHLVGIAVLGVLAAPLSLLQPLALKVVVDHYLGRQPPPAYLDAVMPAWLADMSGGYMGGGDGYLIFAVFLIIIGALALQSIAYCKRLLSTFTRERLALGLRMRLFGHVEKLSLSYHDQEGPSQATFRIMMDTAVIPGLLLAGLIPALQSLAMVVVFGVAMLLLSVKLTLLIFIVVPLLMAASWPFGRSLRRQWHDIKEIDTSMLGRLQEIFSAVRLVKTFGKEQRETEALQDLAEQGVRARCRVARTQGLFSFVLAMGTAVGTAAFLFLGAGMVRGDELQLGELVMLGALTVQFYAPVQGLVGMIASLQSSFASAERALNLLDEAPAVAERADARPLERAVGALSFRDVSFAYEADQPVLRNVSLEVAAGSRVGIVGRTGAGKTTLMNLLTRLHDPTAGAILLDGSDLRDIVLDDLRRQFAVVLQDPVLFKKSVAENINYALPSASMEQTVQAARLANVHDFIESMPDGYDTIVGERGQRLSGGERQRISLARAFLKDSPILILDEPTSSVDMRTEAAIMEAVQRLMEGRTTFIIAHRPSTLEICDKVLALDGGRVTAFADTRDIPSLDALMTAADPAAALAAIRS